MGLTAGPRAPYTKRCGGAAPAQRRTTSRPNGKLYMFMVYTGEESTDIGAASQWIDEVELWETGPLREP